MFGALLLAVGLIVDFGSMWFISCVANGTTPGASSDHANLPEYYK